MKFLFMVDFHVADFLLLPGNCTIADAAAQTLQRHEGTIHDPVVGQMDRQAFQLLAKAAKAPHSPRGECRDESPVQTGYTRAEQVFTVPVIIGSTPTTGVDTHSWNTLPRLKSGLDKNSKPPLRRKLIKSGAGRLPHSKKLEPGSQW
ncbi:MAG: hypothetical protein ACFCU9_08370 [Cyanophyceae cyanobacterium]